MPFASAHARRAILSFWLLATTAGCGPNSNSAAPAPYGEGNGTVPADPPQRSSVTLSWMPPTESSDGSGLQDLAGYTIYSGRTAEALAPRVSLDNPGLTRYIVEPLAPGELYFAIASVNSQGMESDLSEVVHAPPN